MRYLLNQVMTKFVSKETDSPELRRQRAIDKWLATEERNRDTNERLATTHGEYNILPRVMFSNFVDTVRRFIVDIIGDVPPEDSLIGSFSGGASTSRRRTESHPALKYLGEAHSTPEAYDLFLDLAEEMPGWLLHGDINVVTVRGNSLFTVPKNTTIDRVACKEPDVNMFLQKGLGSTIRRCLRRRGINLNDQSINRALAREGSTSGELATLDLSSASDSVSTGLVELVVPDLWFSYLNRCRCSITIIDGEEHVNEMFSSMGNGFTFELESLLFYAIARATAYHRGISGIVSVYGDDIIVPTELYEDLKWTLGFFGFSVNPDKSFAVGSFRESCGGHYDLGRDITPFYIREPVADIRTLILLANNLRSWAGRGGCTILDPDVYPLWAHLKSLIPRRFWGGDNPSSTEQLVSNDEPQFRLRELTKSSRTGKGGYYHWLNATWNRVRVEEAVVTSRHSTTSSLYREVPARRVKPELPQLFLEELENTGVAEV